MDKDVPVLMKKPGKDDPLVFLPREPHPWWQIWSIPEVVPLTRRSVVAMFWVYFMVGAIVQITLSAPKKWRDWKEAERLHITLRKILEREQLYLDSLYMSMTLEEIDRALSPLPLKPGTEWDEEEEDREIVNARVKYPE